MSEETTQEQPQIINLDASNLGEIVKLEVQLTNLRANIQSMSEQMGMTALVCPMEQLDAVIDTLPADSWSLDLMTRIRNLRQQAETQSQAEVVSEALSASNDSTSE